MIKNTILKCSLLFVLLSGQTWAKGSDMIEEVIQDYFQGYQKADVGLIKKAFHSNTRLLSVDQGKLDVIEMGDWLKNLEDRHLRGDIREGKLNVVSIDVTNESAMVKLKISFKSFEFTDYLSLLKIEGKWIIVGKIYDYKPL